MVNSVTAGVIGLGSMGMGAAKSLLAAVLRPMASTATSTPWRRLARPAWTGTSPLSMAARSMCW